MLVNVGVGAPAQSEIRMHGSITARCRRLAIGSAVALGWTTAPYQIAFHGSALGIDAASAYAAKGGNGGGNNGNGGGNGGSSSGGNSGNGNGGNSGNSGGNSGTDGGAAPGSGNGQSDNSASHVNETTGDKVDVDGNKISVQHPDGISEKIENGRFRMQDALGRTIIDRRATPADAERLKAL
jgi:hypothetical protein